MAEKASAFTVNKSVKTEELSLVARARKGESIYQGIFDEMAKLKPGRSFTISPAEGVSVEQLHARLSGHVYKTKNAKVVAPEGTRFSLSKTTDGQVAINCVKLAK